MVKDRLHAGGAEGAHVAAKLQHLVLDLLLACCLKPLPDLPGALSTQVTVPAILGLVKRSIVKIKSIR